MQTNEFRVRPVERFVLTHFHSGEDSQFVRTVGEFPNVEAAEEVGVSLQALVPGSTLTTLDGRQADYPPKALAAAMAVRTLNLEQGDSVVDTVPERISKEVAEHIKAHVSKALGADVLVLGDGMQLSKVAHHQQYVIVQRGFEVDTKAMYAANADEAERLKEECQQRYGAEFRIFSRPVD